jgi:putative sterol carrier protein
MKEVNYMTTLKESLESIISRMNANEKAKSVFVTNIAGKNVNWSMSFQFNLDNEEPFYVQIEDKSIKLTEGTIPNAEIVMSGDPNSIIKICNGKGDFTHAISREEITVEKGKVMDVIRLTRAIAIVLKSK